MMGPMGLSLELGLPDQVRHEHFNQAYMTGAGGSYISEKKLRLGELRTLCFLTKRNTLQVAPC